ncbi:MAG TPA: non-heme iron oxygenase ferredoxin subunit [Candidatus Caldiarchaeum subterraneum]|uniref:Non-heme iron oxygenase ferredoxin subunit n=1 Tax=Caldiarchaeum subterraneum TaxID=311458 RepID=A0A833A3W4_CALS0|nr:non-heme iron oxygenase ferredoxin subunit [Candidatus Caldarchaeum subterraneum]
MGRLVRVCSAEELRERERVVVDVDNESVLVLFVGGRVYALSNICTHEYAEMVNGLVVDDTITCPVHLSRFRLDDGEVLYPPAEKPLKTYKVVEKGGEVFIEL